MSKSFNGSNVTTLKIDSNAVSIANTVKGTRPVRCFSDQQGTGSYPGEVVFSPKEPLEQEISFHEVIYKGSVAFDTFKYLWQTGQVCPEVDTYYTKSFKDGDLLTISIPEYPSGDWYLCVMAIDES